VQTGRRRGTDRGRGRGGGNDRYIPPENINWHKHIHAPHTRAYTRLTLQEDSWGV